MGQLVNLNIIPKGIPDVVNASQYDVGRVIQFALYDGANPYNVSQDATVQVAGKKGDNHIFCYDQTDGVVSWSGNVVTITSTQQMTAYAGEVLAQLRVIDNGDTLATVNFKMLIQVQPDAEGDISETEIPAIIALAEAEMYNAEAWAKGTKNGVPVSSSDIQYNDHSKYWAEKAQEYAVGAVHYKSVITFAQIPTSGMVNGDMYNISDDFTTDNRFAEGSGKYCSAGTNIIWDDATSLWDIAGGLGGVTSWNNRRGDITPQTNDYTAAQVKFSEGVSVADELGDKQPKTLATAITIGGVSQTTVEGALGALNTAKPDSSSLGSAAVKNVPASGDAATTEVVMGNDTRLTNARNAADVYSWAKAATKPSYTASEVGALAADGKANTAGTADKVSHKLSIGGSGDVYYYDGSQKVEIEIWDWPILVEATNWSATVDSDGYYTNTFTMIIGSYVLNIDANKPVFISCSGSTRSNRPTAAQAAAYNLVNEFSFPEALGTVSTITVKAKTKPTVDFYIRLSAMGIWYAT